MLHSVFGTYGKYIEAGSSMKAESVPREAGGEGTELWPQLCPCQRREIQPQKEGLTLRQSLFLSGLGYPLAKSLLIDVWNRLTKDAREQLSRTIEFHHLAFTTRRGTPISNHSSLRSPLTWNCSNPAGQRRELSGRSNSKDYARNCCPPSRVGFVESTSGPAVPLGCPRRFSTRPA